MQHSMILAMGWMLAEALPTAGVMSETWAQWGLAGIVVAFVLWRDREREKEMREQQKQQSEFVQTVLVTTLKENTEKLGALGKLPCAEAIQGDKE
jgi:hypothetical protein